jgi:hypothetical protein
MLYVNINIRYVQGLRLKVVPMRRYEVVIDSAARKVPTSERMQIL